MPITEKLLKSQLQQINDQLNNSVIINSSNKHLINTDGGNLQSKSSVILGNINHHTENQNLLAINILQDIAWSLTNVIKFNEIPNKQLDTNKKLKQFEFMAKESTDVYRELLKHGNKFYFVWKYDKRGRSYSQGYHCNLQSTQYKKAILNFANEELISNK